MNKKFKPDNRLLLGVCFQNLLSFGPDTSPLFLESLNVLIGPNGAGKSNLIDAIALMRATSVASGITSAADVRTVMDRGGGASEWIWKGAKKHRPSTLELVVNNPKAKQHLLHFFSFKKKDHGFRIVDERIENEAGSSEEDIFYRFDEGDALVNPLNGKRKYSSHEKVNLEQSILAHRHDAKYYPEIAYVAQAYAKIRIYREWSFGPDTVFRAPRNSDNRNHWLDENFSNLPLFLDRVCNTPRAKTAIVDRLKDVHEGVTDLELLVEEGSVQVFFKERDFSISATRASDGTLRYLCLLAILCDPSPPPLICIEEPELGLHPDIIPKLADLLCAASERTQLIVTTHSDILVGAMTERLEAIVVCEKHDGRTQMRRLDRNDLEVWLEKYRLGELWTSGLIGGNRW